MKLQTRAHEKSIFRRILLILVGVLVLQMAVYLVVFIRGGVVEQTEKNAFYILGERTANRKLYLENEMLQRWSNTTGGESGVLALVDETLQRQGISARELKSNPALCRELVASATPGVVDMLRRNGVTGAFLVLDCPGAENGYPGVYIRDYDPGNFSENNADLLLERGLPAVARDNKIAMDSFWSAAFPMDDPDAPEAQFFFAPLREATRGEYTKDSSEYYCYWSGRFRLSELDREVMTYSVPLLWEDGTVLGVLGVDLTTDYLADQLKYDELGIEKSGAYFLGMTQDGGETYACVAANGPVIHAYFGAANELTTAPTVYEGTVALTNTTRDDNMTFYAAVEPLRPYNTNSPFEGEQWALLGILDSEHLLGFTHEMQNLVVISTLASLALGLVLILMAVRSITRPIAKLVSNLRGSDPGKPIRLRRIHIAEIDTLTEAIENLSNAAAESAARSSKIINMTHIPVGVFEYQVGGERVFCSAGLPAILDWDRQETEDFYVDGTVFLNYLDSLERITRNEDENAVFRLLQPGGKKRWVQLFYRKEGETVLGAFLDITRDMEEKRKIKYERDYDVLTDLYNRRAFDQKAGDLFLPEHRAELGVAALLMFDLDNLKYVNDTYGHDYGDHYIQEFARSIARFSGVKSVVGRRSGDEFNVLLYGAEGKAQLRRVTDEFWANAPKSSIALPDGKEIKVRASAGLAWYPDDAKEFAELIRLADFAMYNIKHTVKGGMQEFDRASYKEKAILIHGQDALNRLIDGKMVRYALQPIVSARDGSVYGYELLMRPEIEQLENLEQLFRLAKAQSKLHQIERLTWFEALDTFARLKRANLIPAGTLAFINSIGSQALSPESIDWIEGAYADILGRVVVEITEGEEASTAVSAKKREVAQRWGAKIAIDDYGTGFNGENVLVDFSPDLVKIDISIIRDIDTDLNRLALVKNMIHYAKGRNILVLAEGVETRGELEVLIGCGIDFIQGFYVARPTVEVPLVRPEVVAEIQAFYQRGREEAHHAPTEE